MTDTLITLQDAPVGASVRSIGPAGTITRLRVIAQDGGRTAIRLERADGRLERGVPAWTDYAEAVYEIV